MKRLTFVAVAFLVGCNGMGSGANRFLPASAGSADSAGAVTQAIPDVQRGAQTKVHLTMTIPKRHRRNEARAVHPWTISSLTQSVSISVNSGAAQVFNATRSSAACKAGPSGTVCTFVVNAPVGADTFVIATYSSAGGVGTKLDQGSAVFNVVRGKNNAPSVRLGPVVTTTADTGIGSLRYAIGAANAGDTIVLLLPAASTITLSSPLSVANRLSIAGPGVTASARRHGRQPKTTYSGVTLSGGGTQQIFAIAAGATATISGLILTHGKATTTSGGAINNAGTLTLVSDVFTDNSTNVTSPLAIRAPHPPSVKKSRSQKHHAHARPPEQSTRIRHPHCSNTYQIGGAIYNNGTLNVSGTIFDGNTVGSDFASCIYGYGGAIFNDIHGVLTSSGNTYTNNAGYNGGAVYNYGEYGQATFAHDTFDANLGCTAATGCPTSGCTTTCTSSAQGEGAAIYDDYGTGIAVTSCIFENNVAGGNTPDSYGEGGALYLTEGSVTITGSTFSNNLAGGGTTNESEGYGGAIYWDGSGAGLHLTSDTFTNNRASGDRVGEGGAIEASEPIVGSADTFTGNVATGSGSAQYADGYAQGGAIDEDDGLSMSGSTFSGNKATAASSVDGGAINADDPTTLSGDTFTSNTATATGSGGVAPSAYGGAIYTSDGLALTRNVFTSNKATTGGSLATEIEGGAIYNDDTMSSFGDSFVSNSVTATAGTSVAAEGGAIFNDDLLTVTGDTFTTNSATSTHDSYGGALYNDYSNTAISNATFGSNTATGTTEGQGGAIYDDGGLTLSGSVVSKNTASSSGGGIFAAESETIAGVTITGNTVVSAHDVYGGGGGIYGDDSLTITNSTISGNTVTVANTYAGGGGIYNYSGLSISGTTISGNVVLGSGSGSGGGGIFSFDSVAMLNSTIVGNRSSIDGGGYMTYGTYVNSLQNVTIYQNAATVSGGNINNPYTMTLTNTIVAGGTAPTGPDITNTGTITSGDYNIVQTAVSGTALSGTTTHDQTANPLLLALSNNGGPTFTNADQTASPGRAKIPFSGGMCNGVTGSNIDQRGFTRGAAGRCDAGAFEFSGAPSAIRQHVPAVHGVDHGHRQPHHATRPVGATQ
jgi:hypothetical protein